jgi:hypothetical protein
MTKQKCEEFFDNDDNLALGINYIEETMVSLAKNLEVPDARADHR